MLMVHSKRTMIPGVFGQLAQAPNYKPSRMTWFWRCLLRALSAWPS
jgi:hypothetical protein